MPIRLILAASVLALGGCIVAPVSIPAGSIVMGQSCLAGFYQCALPQPSQVGTPCSCPGLGAPSYGTVR